MAPPKAYEQLKDAPTDPFQRWLIIMEGNEKGKAGGLTLLMFRLNALGALGHLVGIVVELALEIRFNMKLPLVHLNASRNDAPNATSPFAYDYYESGFLHISWLLFSIHLQSLVFHAGYASRWAAGCSLSTNNCACTTLRAYSSAGSLRGGSSTFLARAR